MAFTSGALAARAVVLTQSQILPHFPPPPYLLSIWSVFRSPPVNIYATLVQVHHAPCTFKLYRTEQLYVDQLKSFEMQSS